MNIFIKKADQSINVDFDTLSKNVQDYIINYGLKQTLNDVHSQLSSENPDDVMKAVNGRLQQFMAGNVPAGGGGGSRVDALTTELRIIVSDLLRQCGYKTADAKKLCKDPNVGFAHVIASKMAAALKVPMAQVDTDKIDSNVARHWPAIVTRAEAVVAARKTSIDIDI